MTYPKSDVKIPPMAFSSRNPRSRGTTASSMDYSTRPRERSEASAEYEDFKLPDSGQDVYSRVASENYLDSDVIKGAKKRRRNRKILTGVLVSLLAVLLVGSTAAFAYVNRISNNLMNGLDSSLFDALVSTDTPEDPFYVLLLGTDRSEARENSNELQGSYRSDSMMLARLDPRGGKATIVSIPRDSYVQLGSHGKGKINAAHAYGGPTLAVEVVSKVTGVPISHYAEIDFDGFADIVDTLGGIEVDVPIEINDPQAGGHLSAGRQTLNGEQALILCRSRHSYDDYGDGDSYRSANQRLVLSAIAKKFLASDPLTMANTVQALSESILTDMRVDEIIGIARSMSGLDISTDLYTASLPTSSKYMDETWYEIIDEAGWKAMIKRMDQGLPPTEGDKVDDLTGTVLASSGSGTLQSQYSVNRTQKINIRNGNGTDGVCADAQRVLEEMGYRNFDVGNADNFDYPQTLVVYKESKNADFAQQIVDALGVGTVVKDSGQYLFESDYLIVIGGDWHL